MQHTRCGACGNKHVNLFLSVFILNCCRLYRSCGGTLIFDWLIAVCCAICNMEAQRGCDPYVTSYTYTISRSSSAVILFVYACVRFQAGLAVLRLVGFAGVHVCRVPLTEITFFLLFCSLGWTVIYLFRSSSTTDGCVSHGAVFFVCTLNPYFYSS